MGLCFSSEIDFDAHPYVQEQFIGSILEELQLSRQNAEALLIIFLSMDKDRDGRINARDFFRYTRTKKTIFSERIFAVYIDCKSQDSVSFGDFLTGVKNLCTVDDHRFIQFVFDVFDIDKVGFLTMEESDALIRMIHNTDEADSNCMSWIRSQSPNDKLTLQGFLLAVEKYPFIFQPAIDIRRDVRISCLGEKFWKSYIHSRPY